MLVNEKKITQIKLWGKIKGTQQDYYIAEGVVEAGGDEEGGGGNPEDMEPKGSGVNKFTYWATNSPTKQWT